MKICVINPGVVHAVPRTLAMRSAFDEIAYIDMRGTDDGGILERYGIAYHRFEAGRHQLAGFRLQRLLRRIAPSGIICHFASGPHFFHSLLYNKCPVAVVAMGQDVLYEAGDAHVGKMLRLLIRMALRRVDFVSAKSNYLARRITEYGRVKPMEVNYWGLDLTVFHPGVTAKSRDQLGLPHGVPIVLSPRALEPRLNIDLIVQAFERILHKHPDAILILAGRSRDDYREKLRVQVADAGIADKVRILGDLDRDRLISHYQAANIVVSMARSEGFPNSVLEAMACEKAVIVGRIPQVTELLKDGYNARICGTSASALAEALLGLLSEPARCAELGRRARGTVMDVADLARNGTRFSAEFRKIIDAAQGRRKRIIGNAPFSLAYVGYLTLSRTPWVR